MGDNLKMKKVFESLDAPGMVVMAMSEEQVFDLIQVNPTSLNISQKSILRPTTTGIHQGGMAGEIDQIDRGIFR